LWAIQTGLLDQDVDFNEIETFVSINHDGAINFNIHHDHYNALP
jgi:hypothetical protein